MLLFGKLVDGTQKSKPPEDTRRHNLSKFSILAPFRAIYFPLFQCETPCIWLMLSFSQSYEIKSSPWTILWFRILGIFSVENIAKLGVFMFQTSDNSQLCIDLQYSSQ
jgi:hypothetical protein